MSNIPKMTVEKIDDIANYYGFKHIKYPYPRTDIRDSIKWKILDKNSLNNKKNSPFSSSKEEKTSIVKKHIENITSKPNLPLLVYHSEPIFKTKKKPLNKDIHLDIFGASKGIAEATIIKTALTILSEEGFKKAFIDINSTGDKESFLRFIRELTDYYKKHLDVLTGEYRQVLKRNPLEIFQSEDEVCKELRKDAPKPIDFLSDRSQRHFKEVIEFLEATETPYKINHELVSEDSSYSKTIFDIRTEDISTPGESLLLARGGRYDEFAEKVTGKRCLPAVGILIKFKRVKEQRPMLRTDKKFRFYLAQIGPEAKMRSFKIIEILRQAKVQAYHQLNKDKMTEQLSTINEMHIPYSLIIGHKEAKENTVILRNMDTMSQRIIPISELYDQIKNIR